MKFALPLAPSTNNLFLNAERKGRRPISAKYAAWKIRAGVELNTQRAVFKAHGIKLPIGGDGFVCIYLPLIENADLDNRFKATLDLLVSHEILANDDMRVVRTIQACVDISMAPDRMQVLVATCADMIAGAHTVHIEEAGHA